MVSLRDYLRDHAEFYCLPVDSHQDIVSAVNGVEVEQALARWDSSHAVIEAHCDAHLVDALINVLNEELGEKPVPDVVNGLFEQQYRRDMGGNRVIRNKPDAKAAVERGPVIPLELIMSSCGEPIEVGREAQAPSVRSKIDYVFTTTGGKKALVGMKSPRVFDMPAGDVFKPSNGEVGFEVQLDLEGPATGLKIIMKACVYMILYGSDWLVLSCFTKWMFLRLHSRGVGELPYVTYSTVEKQIDNTRPFRALVGMMLSIARGIDVPSNADMDRQLRPMPATKEGL